MQVMLTPFTIDATPGTTTVTVDGVPVNGVAAVRLEAEHGRIPQLTIAIDAEGIIRGEGIVDYDTTSPGDAVRAIDPDDVRDRVDAQRSGMRFDDIAAACDILADILDERA